MVESAIAEQGVGFSGFRKFVNSSTELGIVLRIDCDRLTPYYASRTMYSELQIPDYALRYSELRIPDYAVRTTPSGLRIANYALQTTLSGLRTT